MIRWIWDWARYHNSHSSKSIRVTKLSFGQNGLPRSTPLWQKNSLVTLTLFELWLSWYLAQSQIHRITLYKIPILKSESNVMTVQFRTDHSVNAGGWGEFIFLPLSFFRNALLVYFCCTFSKIFTTFLQARNEQEIYWNSFFV